MYMCFAYFFSLFAYIYLFCDVNLHAEERTWRWWHKWWGAKFIFASKWIERYYFHLFCWPISDTACSICYAVFVCILIRRSVLRIEEAEFFLFCLHNETVFKSNATLQYIYLQFGKYIRCKRCRTCNFIAHRAFESINYKKRINVARAWCRVSAQSQQTGSDKL